jgi:molybdenum cofactor cytidylyltransferase
MDRLIFRFAETGAGIIRPLARGGPAHPVLMAAKYFPEIMALEGDVGAREILARHPEDVTYIELDDPRSTLDVDTPADYEAAERRPGAAR